MKRIVKALNVLLFVGIFLLSSLSITQAALSETENSQVICESAGGTVHVFGETKVGVLVCTDFNGAENTVKTWFDTCSNLKGFPEQDEDTLLCLIKEVT